MGARRGRLSAPWSRFHGVGRADVYIIIRVRASGCGESALNPPTSQPIPHRRPSPVPAQQHALPEHFLTPFPRTSARPRSPNARPQAAPCIPRRPHHPFPAEDLLPPPHSDTPFPSTSAPPRSTDAHPPTSQPIPRRRPAPAPAQRRALPEHFLTPAPRRCTPADPTTHSPSKICSRPRTATRTARALSLPHAAPTHARRPHHPFPTEDLRPPPQRRPASPSVPLRAQKNGTAQWMCDAECLGRPSLRSVIGVGEPRAVRRRCGALAWRVGLRPQPWALRSRRCGRVLRA